MNIYNVYAQIKENKVKNIMVCDNYELANNQTRLVYGDDAVAVNCTNYRVHIGYQYKDGSFLDDKGEIVEREKTFEEEILSITKKVDNLYAALDDLSITVAK